MKNTLYLLEQNNKWTDITSSASSAEIYDIEAPVACSVLVLHELHEYSMRKVEQAAHAQYNHLE